MLYLSHLSFQTVPEDGEPWHGYFTCVVEGGDVDDALEQTRNVVLRLKSDEDMLDDVEEVFLEACVEIKSMPGEGFMAFFQEWDGAVEGSISTGTRGASEDEVVAYEWLGDGEEEDADDEAEAASQDHGHGHEAHEHSHGDEDAGDDVEEVRSIEPFVVF